MVLNKLNQSVSNALDRAFSNAGEPVYFGSNSSEASGFFSSNGQTSEGKALRVSAFFACVRLIAGTIASLPLAIYERKENDEREKSAHNYGWLLNESPTPRYTSSAMWEKVISDQHLHGDGYVLLVKNPLNQVVEMRPMCARSTQVERVGNRLVYYFEDDGRRFGADQSDVLHFPNFGFDGKHGKPTLTYAASTATNIASSADEHARLFFESGTQSKHAVTHPGKLSQEAVESFQREWANRYGGNSNASRPILLQNGVSIQELSMSATDAQLLESRQFSVEEIARAFGVPPVLIGQSSASLGTAVKEITRGFIIHTVGRYLKPIAQEINRKFWPTRERYFVEHNTDAYLQNDPKERAEVFRNALGGAQGSGWVSPNEVRRLQNLPSIPGGDVVYVPPLPELKTGP